MEPSIQGCGDKSTSQRLDAKELCFPRQSVVWWDMRGITKPQLREFQTESYYIASPVFKQVRNILSTLDYEVTKCGT